MTNLQKLTIRASEIRQRLNEISGVKPDDLTDEIRQESDRLTTEYRDTETQLRAAVVADEGAPRAGVEDAEARELRALTDRASVGRIVSAVVERRQTDGADLELQQHCRMPANMIPLDLLRDHSPVEVRAVTGTPANAATMQEQPIPPVFAQGAGAFLGVDRPTVAYGSAVYPVLTSRPTVHGPVATSADAAETTGAFDADLLAPERLQSSFIYRRSDSARFEGMDDSLRMALNGGLEEALDKEVISGDEGLLAGTNLTAHARTSSTDFAAFVSQFCYARVDGRFAAMQSDVRSVMGSASYAKAGATYQTQPHMSALDVLLMKSGGVRVSAHVAAVASNKQQAAIRLGMRRDMVQPLWNGVTIITDEVTGSGKGEIEITAVLLMNTKILRAAGFYKQEVNVS